MKTINTDDTNDTIVFSSSGATEMLRIGPDGFYVRGKKIPQDANESKTVYEEFLAWMRQAKLAPVIAVALACSLLSSCETVAPDASDSAEASIFNEAFGTSVVAQPKKKLMFLP